MRFIRLFMGLKTFSAPAVSAGALSDTIVIIIYLAKESNQ